jgi:hypothetical protein
MTEVELNGDLIAEYLEQRELYGVAQMIRRQDERGEPEGPQASTYLAMAVAEPVGRFGVRPMVTGAGFSALPGPAWCHDPTGTEPPLGFSIEEVGAALGGASHEPPVGNGVEVSCAVSRRSEERANGGER